MKNEHDDQEIVDVLARDFPHVFEQILEYLDELQDSMELWGGSLPLLSSMRIFSEIKTIIK